MFFTGIIWEDTLLHKEPYGVVVVNSATNSVYLAFHGTITVHDYGVDLKTKQTVYSISCPKILHRLSGKVHKGWYKLYKKIRENILKRLLPTFNLGYTLYISGHSLGASLSNFAMAEYYCTHSSYFTDIILYNTAAPRIGNIDFQTSWSARIPASNTISLINTDDPVPLFPPDSNGTNYYPVGSRFNFSVNWEAACAGTPSLLFCTANHDPKCVYYYSVSQFIANISETNGCNCAVDNQCDLCIPNATNYNFGCPILKNKIRHASNPAAMPTSNKVELRNLNKLV